MQRIDTKLKDWPQFNNHTVRRIMYLCEATLERHDVLRLVISSAMSDDLRDCPASTPSSWNIGKIGIRKDSLKISRASYL